MAPERSDSAKSTCRRSAAGRRAHRRSRPRNVLVLSLSYGDWLFALIVDRILSSLPSSTKSRENKPVKARSDNRFNQTRGLTVAHLVRELAGRGKQPHPHA